MDKIVILCHFVVKIEWDNRKCIWIQWDLYRCWIYYFAGVRCTPPHPLFIYLYGRSYIMLTFTLGGLRLALQIYVLLHLYSRVCVLVLMLDEDYLESLFLLLKHIQNSIIASSMTKPHPPALLLPSAVEWFFAVLFFLAYIPFGMTTKTCFNVS